MPVRKYLGQGEKFPTQITPQGRVALVNDLQLVEQSLRILFEEPIGTELYREHYGSQIRRALFTPNDAIITSLLDYYIADAINKWERRITLVDIKYSQPPDQPERIDATVFFQIRQSSQINSQIFPFYRQLNN
jgi:uncharacterized protein